MALTAQAYALGAASRGPEGLAALGFLPVSGNEVPMSETDALIMRGMLKVYADDLPGAIADLGVAAAGCASECRRPTRARAWLIWPGTT
jgi:hypothetical protein